MMITLGNNKAMKTFQKPTMFESFSEIEHNKVNCSSDGQLTETQTNSLALSSQIPTVQSKIALTGNQNIRSGSKVKLRTTLINLSPPCSPTDNFNDSVNNNFNNEYNQQQIISFKLPVNKNQIIQQKTNCLVKKNIVRCDSVDSLNRVNGYSSLSSNCSTVINRPSVQKINWETCSSTNCKTKLPKFNNQIEENVCSKILFNEKKIKNYDYNQNSTLKTSKTVDNIVSFTQPQPQPQQQHQTCPQFRETMQKNKFNSQRSFDLPKNKEIIFSKTLVNKNENIENKFNPSNINNQQNENNKNSNNQKTSNVISTGFSLPQLTTQPLIAIRRILLLYENLQFKETAQFISRLQNACFQLIVRDLPVGLFIEQMPQSLVVLEALYSKLYSSLQELDCLYSNGALIVSSAQLSTLPELNPNQTVNHTIGRNLLKLLQPESVTMHLVKMFALKSHAHQSVYDCSNNLSVNSNIPTTNNIYLNSNTASTNAFMQERFDSNHPVMITMTKLLKTILKIQPPISKQLAARKRAIDNAIDAMGHHGLVSTGNNLSNNSAGSLSPSASSSSNSSTSSSTSNGTSVGSPINGFTNSLENSNVLMMSLHDALKLEFDFVIQQYKLASQKLDEAVNLANTGNSSKQLTPMKFTMRNLNKMPAPSSASHQRQLSLRPDEIQLRLMRNKSLMNSLEHYVLNQHSVQILMGILEQRINYDKETLFQFTQLRKEFNYCCTLSQQLASSFGGGAAAHGHTVKEPNATMVSGCVHNNEMNCCIDSNAVVSPVLMRFSYGCGQVLRVFEKIASQLAAEAENISKNETLSQQPKKNNEKSSSTSICLENKPSKTLIKNVKDIETDKVEENIDESSILRNCKVVINNQKNLKNKMINYQSSNNLQEPSIDSLNEIAKVNYVEQIEKEETRQSSSDISGYHSDENTDYLINAPLQNGQTNSECSNNGKNSLDLQSRHSFSRNSSTPLSSVSYSSSCSSDLRNEDLKKKPILQNLLDLSNDQHHHKLDSIDTSINYLDNEQGDQCWITQQQSRYSENETIALKRELIRSKQTIFELQEREQQLLNTLKQKQNFPTDLMSDNSIPKKISEVTLTPITFSPEKRRPCALIRKFGDLYSQARVDTLDSLDSIEQLKEADELKAKILFSVIVLSFRSIQKTITDIKQKICNLLQIYDCDKPNQNAIKQLETSINTYLKENVDTFNTDENLEEVSKQIWTTLYDYPCLKDCSGLNKYINDCIKLAWTLSVQTPAYLIKFDNKIFDPNYHVRFHISDSSDSKIKNYLWPALIEEGENGVCVHKGVVTT